MNALEQDAAPVAASAWTPATLLAAYVFYQIRDERGVCPCGRFTVRTFDGKCYTCHRANFIACGRRPCPPLPAVPL